MKIRRPPSPAQRVPPILLTPSWKRKGLLREIGFMTPCVDSMIPRRVVPVPSCLNSLKGQPRQGPRSLARSPLLDSSCSTSMTYSPFCYRAQPCPMTRPWHPFPSLAVLQPPPPWPILAGLSCSVLSMLDSPRSMFRFLLLKTFSGQPRRLTLRPPRFKI